MWGSCWALLCSSSAAAKKRGWKSPSVSCFPCRVYEIACSSNTKGTVCFLSKTNIKCFPLHCCPKGCLVPSASLLAKATQVFLSLFPTPSTQGQGPCGIHIPAHVDLNTGAVPGQETPSAGTVGSLAPIHGTFLSQPSRQTPCHRSGLDKLKVRKEGAKHEAVTKC